MRGLRAVCASLALALCTGIAAPALAGPSVWAKARDPDLERRSRALAQAEAKLLKADRADRDGSRDPSGALKLMYLREAKQILEDAGAATSHDWRLRVRLAHTLFLLQEHKAAVELYEAILRSGVPAQALRQVYRHLAVSYGHLARRDAEIDAYVNALSLEPDPVWRSVLLTNRAEALMAIGQLTAAVDGYRAALSSLSQLEMRAGVTTLWGLAVALDRSGDLDEAMSSIRLARAYDPADTQIRNRDVWTFDPEHDEHWYTALGYWSAARYAELGAARAEWYGRAVTSWEEYIAAAPTDDRYLELARVRLKQCQKERDATQKRFKDPTSPAGRDNSARRRGRD